MRTSMGLLLWMRHMLPRRSRLWRRQRQLPRQLLLCPPHNSRMPWEADASPNSLCIAPHYDRPRTSSVTLVWPPMALDRIRMVCNGVASVQRATQRGAAGTQSAMTALECANASHCADSPEGTVIVPIMRFVDLLLYLTTFIIRPPHNF